MFTMTASELFLYGLIALAGAAYVRRLYLRWRIPHYSASELGERIASGEPLVMLDVRTAGERKERSIEGSIHIPLPELGTRMDELKRHRNKEIVVYCRSGNRSLSAAAKLVKKGFTVANLKGGISEWNFRNRK